MPFKTIEWKAKYQVGVEEIDLQHRYFLDLINRLSRDLRSAAHFPYRSALIAELNAYARFHFISEENMMLFAGYPALEQHRQQHADLLNELSNIEVELDLGNVTDDAGVDETIDFLFHWFVHHTAESDQEFARYLGAGRI